MRSLRVLFFATRDWFNPGTTGGDNTLWENARYLAAVGHRVTFVAAGFRGAPNREVLDGINVVRLGGVHSLWARTFLYYMTQCRGGYDCVVTEGFGGSRIPRLAPLYVREPIITSWHQLHRDLFAAQYPWLLVGALNALERVTAWVHRKTWVQAYTPEWKEAFPSIGFRPDKVFVVPVSIRDEWLGDHGRRRPSSLRMLWIGKFRRYKCPHHVVLAMSDVVKAVPTARLTLVGRHDDLRYEGQLRQMIAEQGLEHAVEFRFNVSEQEKRDLLEASRVLVLPSAVEGFGIVVLEANARGLPVVASSGVPESVVRHLDNGLRYPYGDLNLLSQRLIQLLTDDALALRLAKNGRSFAKKFRWEHVGAEYETAVARAVSHSTDAA